MRIESERQSLEDLKLRLEVANLLIDLDRKSDMPFSHDLHDMMERQAANLVDMGLARYQNPPVESPGES